MALTSVHNFFLMSGRSPMNCRAVSAAIRHSGQVAHQCLQHSAALKQAVFDEFSFGYIADYDYELVIAKPDHARFAGLFCLVLDGILREFDVFVF